MGELLPMPFTLEFNMNISHLIIDQFRSIWDILQYLGHRDYCSHIAGQYLGQREYSSIWDRESIAVSGRERV